MDDHTLCTLSPHAVANGLMPYAINLTLDADTSDMIERAYARVRSLNIPDADIVMQYGPCITILVIENRIAAATIARSLELRLPTLTAFSVTFSEPCIILGVPPTLSLRILPAHELLKLHHALYAEFPEDAVHLHYRPAYWQPHTKLANVRENHATTVKLLAAYASGNRPHTGAVEAIEVIHYSPIQSIWQARLRRGPEN